MNDLVDITYQIFMGKKYPEKKGERFEAELKALCEKYGLSFDVKDEKGNVF